MDSGSYVNDEMIRKIADAMMKQQGGQGQPNSGQMGGMGGMSGGLMGMMGGGKPMGFAQMLGKPQGFGGLIMDMFKK